MTQWWLAWAANPRVCRYRDSFVAWHCWNQFPQGKSLRMPLHICIFYIGFIFLQLAVGLLPEFSRSSFKQNLEFLINLQINKFFFNFRKSCTLMRKGSSTHAGISSCMSSANLSFGSFSSAARCSIQQSWSTSATVGHDPRSGNVLSKEWCYIIEGVLHKRHQLHLSIFAVVACCCAQE